MHLEGFDDGECRIEGTCGALLMRLTWQPKGTHRQKTLLIAAQLQAPSALLNHHLLHQLGCHLDDTCPPWLARQDRLL